MKYDFPFDTDEQIGDFIRNVKEQMKNWSDIIDLVVLDMLNNLRFDLENDTFYISIYDHKIKLGHVTYHDNYHISVSDDLDFLGNDAKICKILNNNYCEVTRVFKVVDWFLTKILEAFCTCMRFHITMVCRYCDPDHKN